MSTPRRMFLGGAMPPTGGDVASHHLSPHHLVTHGVVLGMTGSGKTGLLMVTVEEALRSRVPVIMIDVKGDLPNLLLAFQDFEASAFTPWLEGHGHPDEVPAAELAAQLARERQRELGVWGITEDDLGAFARGTALRVLTPGSTAGEPVHILSSLERRSTSWDKDPEASRAAVSAAISLVLRLLGKDPDPARSREHVLLSVLAERRMLAGQTAELASLLDEVLTPPIDRIGAMDIDDFLPLKERKNLAAALNTLLASPTFASWRQGSSLDVAEWLTPKDGRTPAVIVSVAHLDDDERTLVLGVLLEEILAYTRSLPGSKRLRALIVFDECYGLLPPHPANPPTKRPTVALMKQGRAFGVGVIVATQNPMDLDYRTLSNAGFWAVGRLQTDADRERVVDSLANANEPGSSEAELSKLIRRLEQRWFLVRNVHATPNSVLLQPRWALSYLRGPMTLGDIRRGTAQ
jgi:helicase HerA-like protein